MKSRSPGFRVPQFRLRALLVVVVLFGLLFAVVAQSVRLNRATLREARLLAELQWERARAEANLQKARVAVDLFSTEVAERSVAAESRNEEPRREFLERALEFYEGMESSASSPEQKARVRERVQQTRTHLEDKE